MTLGIVLLNFSKTMSWKVEESTETSPCTHVEPNPEDAYCWKILQTARSAE